YAGIDPRRAAGKITRKELQKLVPAIQKVLNKSIDLGGSSLRDYTHADGKLGSFQHEFAVYGREGKRCPGCRCNLAKTGGVNCLTLGGRSTFYCPVKQG
ncbi:MAG TPA: DNA-formamidopyrimidine glycosylase, partial [Alphaproteobacteria bacterium]|nr:DNA-formamidopyrimidine glycosylase [Alphaproteobacteria bacterium]